MRIEATIKFLLTVTVVTIVWTLYDATSKYEDKTRDMLEDAAVWCAKKLPTARETMTLQLDASGKFVCSITSNGVLTASYTRTP